MKKAEIKKVIREWFKTTNEKIADVDIWTVAGYEYVSVITVASNHVAYRHGYAVESDRLRHISTKCLM